MSMPNFIHAKGSILAAPGGGGAYTDLPPGAPNEVLVADPNSDLGLNWGAGGVGTMNGPVSSIAGNLPSFANTDGDLLDDSGISAATVAIGPGTSVANRIAAFLNTDGLTLKDSGVLYTNVVQGPASSTDNSIARFDSTTGKLIQNSAATMADTTGAITFPSGGGTILTAGAGSAERKGTFTFDGSGTHTKILTTAAVTGCVISYSIVTLGTVTAAQAILSTIDTGVGFTPVSADATDSSVVNWAIVA